MKRHDAKTVLNLAEGRWYDIHVGLGIDPGLLDRNPRPCPACGGTDRFEYDCKQGDGWSFCRHCGGKGAGGPLSPIGLLMNAHGWDYSRAINEVGEWLHAPTDNGEPRYTLPPRPAAPAPESAWKAVVPVPEDAAPLESGGRCVFWNPKRAADPEYNGSATKPALLSAYRDQSGLLWGYVLRMEFEDGGKATLQICWAEHRETGERRWVSMRMPSGRPLLGVHEITAETKTVIGVEGEKTREAARRLLPASIAVVTCAGGPNGMKFADWSPVAGKRFAWWPDNDTEGMRAAHGTILPGGERVLGACDFAIQAGASAARVIAPPGDVPDKWDLADGEAEGWTRDRVLAHIKSAAVDPQPIKAGAPTHEPAPADEPPAWVSEPVPDEPEQHRSVGAAVALAAPVDNAPATLNAVDWWAPMPDINSKGTPLATIENVHEAVNRLGVVCRYNVISKDVEIVIPGAQFTVDNAANCSLAWVVSALERFRIPTGKAKEYIGYIAEQNVYNPVAAWILSRPWDGRSRFNDLVATIKTVGENTDLDQAVLKRTLIRKWMLSAVAAAMNSEGVSAHGVLVLQGPQDLGKTKWFKSLVPEHLRLFQDGLSLRADDRDSVKQALSFWLVELGELDATFRKSDIAQLKAFITRDRDVLRRPFAPLESHYARRTVFCGSVNPRQYLHDQTGNRRYWTLECIHIDHNHRIDMQQVWSEIYNDAYLAGESWFLTKDETALLNSHNNDYEQNDPIDELLATRYNWSAPEFDWRWISATDVMRELGFDKPSRSDVTACGTSIQSRNGGQSKRTSSCRLAKMPPLIRK